MTEVTLSLMGKNYHIKCLESEVEALQQTASFLEEKMSNIRHNHKTLSADQVAVLTALNLAHDALQIEKDARLIQDKIDAALSRYL